MTPTDRAAPFRARLTAAERAGPDQDTTVKILAGDLRAAHAQAVSDRTRAAAVLHYHHGWTFTQLCVAIHGRPSKVAAVRESVEKVGRPARMSKVRAEEAFEVARTDAQELWALYKQATTLRDQAKAETGEPEVVLDLPATPAARVEAAAARLHTVNPELANAVEARNRAAAALIAHGGWSKRQAADLAGAAVRDLYPHEKTAPKSEADSALVARLASQVRQLTALRTALTRARDEAIRELSASVGPAEIARLARITDERVVQVRDAR